MKRSMKAAMATAILMACLPALCVAQETVKNVQRYVLETRSDDDGGHGDHDDEHEYAELAIQAKMSKYWLGVVTEALEGALKDHLDTDGLIIEEVVEDSPAAAAGLKANDIVVKVAGKKIADVKTLVEIIGDNGAKPMKIEILRKGRSKTMTATPAKRPQGKATDLAIPHEQILRFQPGMTMKWATPMAGADVIALADGGNSISITVEKNGEGPAKVKIQHNGEMKEFETDDFEEMKDLPEDVSKHLHSIMKGLHGKEGAQVAWLLKSRGQGSARAPSGQWVSPNWGQATFVPLGGADSASLVPSQLERIAKKLEQLEKRLDKLTKDDDDDDDDDE